MKRRCKNLKYGSMQVGGSVYDYMTGLGMDGSYKNRKKMYDHLFDGKYAGTAEQNIELLRILQSQNQAPATRRLDRTILDANEVFDAEGNELAPTVVRQGSRRLGKPIVSADTLPTVADSSSRLNRLTNNRISVDDWLATQENEPVRTGRRNRRMGLKRLQLGEYYRPPEELIEGVHIPYSTNGSNWRNNRPFNTPVDLYAPTERGDIKEELRDNPIETYFNNLAYKPNPLMGIGIGIQAGMTGLAAIGSKMERNRQDQYMYDQYSSLGQGNPMPVDDYQPNPYNLYAKYGGKLKDYQSKNRRKGNKLRYG